MHFILMTPKWNFTKRQISNKHRSPTSNYHFSNNDDPLVYLVREAVQNSLDALLKEKYKKVTFSLTIDEMPSETNFYDENLEKRVKESNIRFSKEKKFSVVIEDSNTTGLTGEHDINPISEKSNYSSFAFYEGSSNKIDRSRGKFGIGKQVFASSSSINSYHVLSKSIENDDEFLFGISTLDYHKINNNYYEPDGFWGEESTNKKNYNMPCKEKTIIDNFRNIFKIKRKKNESGTSIVVPYVEIRNKDKVFNDITCIILDEYLFTILDSSIEFKLYIFTEEKVINKENVIEFINDINDNNKKQLLLDRYTSFMSIINSIENSNFTIKHSLSTNDIKSNQQDENKILSDFIVSENMNKFIEMFINDSNDITFDMSLLMKKNNDTMKGRFIVCIRKNTLDTSYSPIFIRKGLVISNANTSKMSSGVSATLYIPEYLDDSSTINNLSDFLNSCENPSHTNWSVNGDMFKNSIYNIHGNKEYSEGVLRIIKQFVFQLEKKLFANNDKIINNVFTELFSNKAKIEGTNSNPIGTGGHGRIIGGLAYKSTLSYDSDKNIYELTLDYNDNNISNIALNYLNNDYGLSKYDSIQFTLSKEKNVNESLRNTFYIESYDNIDIDINSNIITFKRIDLTKNSTLKIYNTNEYKMLGVTLS